MPFDGFEPQQILSLGDRIAQPSNDAGAPDNSSLKYPQQHDREAFKNFRLACAAGQHCKSAYCADAALTHFKVHQMYILAQLKEASMPCSDNIKTSHVEFFGLKARYLRVLDSLAERGARRKVYRKTVADLQALSDRDLADFGFHRSEIPQIARKAAGSA